MKKPSINHLIEELKSVERCKQQLPSLEISIDVLERRVYVLNQKLFDINDAIEQRKDSWWGNLSKNRRLKQEEKVEDLKDAYLHHAAALAEAKESLELQQFELKVIQENIEREDELFAALKGVVLADQSGASNDTGDREEELSRIFRRMENLSSAREQVQKILISIEQVVQVVKDISLKIKHKLHRSVKTMRYEREDKHYEGITLTSEKTVDEIQALCLKLKREVEKAVAYIEQFYATADYDPIHALQQDRYIKDLKNLLGICKAFFLTDFSVSAASYRRPPQRDKNLKKLKEDFSEEEKLIEFGLVELKNEFTSSFLQGEGEP